MPGLAEAAVRRQTSRARMQAKKARRVLARRPGRRKRRPTAAMKRSWKKMKSSGVYKKISRLRASLDLPATITGSIGHRREFIDMVLEASLDYEKDARAFAKLFLKKEPVYSNTDTGMTALQFETYLYDKETDLASQFLETYVTGSDTTFLAIFQGKVKPLHLEKFERGIKDFCTLETLVKAGDADPDEGIISDVTIFECTPKRGKGTKARDTMSQRPDDGLPRAQEDYELVVDEGGLSNAAFRFLYPEAHLAASDSEGVRLAEDGNGMVWCGYDNVWLPDVVGTHESADEAKGDYKEFFVEAKVNKHGRKYKVVSLALEGKKPGLKAPARLYVDGKLVGEFKSRGEAITAGQKFNESLDEAKTFAVRTEKGKKPAVLAAIRKKDKGMKVGQEGNPVTAWVTTKLSLSDIEGIAGVKDAVLATKQESVTEGHATTFQDTQRAKRFANEVRPYARKVRLNGTTVYYEARTQEARNPLYWECKACGNKTPRDKKTKAADLGPCKCGKNNWKEGKAPSVKEQIDTKRKAHMGTSPVKATVTEADYAGQGIVAMTGGEGEPDPIRRTVHVITPDQPLYYDVEVEGDEEDGIPTHAQLASKFEAWLVRRDTDDNEHTLVAVGQNAYRLDASLSDMKELLEKMSSIYGDLPEEFDMMAEAFLTEYCEENGVPVAENTVSQGLIESLSHEFIAERNATAALNGKMRLLAVGEGTANFKGKKATTKTVPCPKCGSKVLAATGYCTKCGKKTVQKEDLEEVERQFRKGDKLTVSAHKMPKGKGLTYPAFTGKAAERGSTGGWDVWDVTPNKPTKSGGDAGEDVVSVYGFSITVGSKRKQEDYADLDEASASKMLSFSGVFINGTDKEIKVIVKAVKKEPFIEVDEVPRGGGLVLRIEGPPNYAIDRMKKIIKKLGLSESVELTPVSEEGSPDPFDWSPEGDLHELAVTTPKKGDHVLSHRRPMQGRATVVSIRGDKAQVKLEKGGKVVTVPTSILTVVESDVVSLDEAGRAAGTFVRVTTKKQPHWGQVQGLAKDHGGSVVGGTGLIREFRFKDKSGAKAFRATVQKTLPGAKLFTETVDDYDHDDSVTEGKGDWGTGLKRGDKMICLRRYDSKKEAEAHLSSDHADADKLDPKTWFDTPMTYRFKPGAKVVAILETPKAKRILKARRAAHEDDYDDPSDVGSLEEGKAEDALKKGPGSSAVKAKAKGLLGKVLVYMQKNKGKALRSVEVATALKLKGPGSALPVHLALNALEKAGLVKGRQPDPDEPKRYVAESLDGAGGDYEGDTESLEEGFRIKLKKGTPQKMDKGDTSTFEQWRKKVDRYVQRGAGLSLDDLPDVPLRDWYEKRIRASRAAQRAVKSAQESLDEARAGALTMKVGGRKVTEPTHMQALARKAGVSKKAALKRWGQAQLAVEKQYPEVEKKSSRYYALTTAIFKSMIGLGKKKAG